MEITPYATCGQGESTMIDVIERLEAAMPSDKDTQLAQQASRALARRTEEDLKVRLEDGNELVLPKAATRLLNHILTEMSQGNAVTIIPLHAELTTQEAADILNVSRPYLIKLLTEKRIPFHMTGTHRRIKFTDLHSYEAETEKKRKKAMDDLAKQAQELNLGY